MVIGISDDAMTEEQKKQAALNAEVAAGRWLADGNEAREAGKTAKAERCYAKAQHWLDRYNELTGRS